jgi:hypothetical protein
MTNRSNSMKPLRRQQALDTDLAISPMDYELPASANIAQHRTWQRQELFLEAFSVVGSVAAACAETGIPVATVESWALRDLHGFKKRKDWAGQHALGLIEAEIDRRGRVGIDKPVFWRGQQVDTVKEYSDNLLMFRAKRLDPAYKDNYRAPESTPNVVTLINIHLHPDVKLPAPRE